MPGADRSTIPLNAPSEAVVAPVATLVPAGRVVEISASVPQGSFTLAVQFVLDTQRSEQPCAWIQPKGAGLFPPDLVGAGVVLAALVVVHAPPDASAVARGAELLLRSGGFGLVVLDLTGSTPRGESWLLRLAGLARLHQARVVLLTSRPAEQPSSGALVALRVEPRRCSHANHDELVPYVLRDRCDLARRVAPTLHCAPWEALR